MHHRFVMGFLICCFAATLAAQVKTVSARRTSPVAGTEMYAAYCAVCHGLNGSGNGPAAVALKTAPTNLTQLAKQNGGRFPDLKVMNAVGNPCDPDAPGHDSRPMPTWGTIFRHMDDNGSSVALRVYNLMKYIESIQEK